LVWLAATLSGGSATRNQDSTTTTNKI